MKSKRNNINLRFSFLGLLIVISMFLLVACGNNSGSTSTGSGSTTHSSTATPTDPNHISLARLIGTPTAKITSGANFEVTGQVKNLDTKQHDIHLQATLKDASGKVVGTATGLADDVPGGETDTYILDGTLTQPTWSTVSVVITKVTENVDGQGTD
ncbi:MAG TPA: hypothetical protein VFA09_26620 [Ktedonobacteraceae bacterium]|nr:hypothetical protein [Ktedonobacteraceae bacterium]